MFGLDVSKFQGEINWAAIPIEYAQFVYVRAKGSEGGRDETFERNYLGAAFSGRRVGSYGFIRWLEDPVDWANDWMDYTQPWSPLNLMPMLDVEAPHAHQVEERSFHDSMSVAQRHDWVRTAVEVLRARQAAPLIYTGYNYWKTYMGGSGEFSDLPVCLARYSHSPGDISHPSFGANKGYEPWKDWMVHQFTSSHLLPGQGRDQRVDRLFVNPKYAGFDLVPYFRDLKRDAIHSAIGL